MDPMIFLSGKEPPSSLSEWMNESRSYLSAARAVLLNEPPLPVLQTLFQSMHECIWYSDLLPGDIFCCSQQTARSTNLLQSDKPKYGACTEPDEVCNVIAHSRLLGLLLVREWSWKPAGESGWNFSERCAQAGLLHSRNIHPGRVHGVDDHSHSMRKFACMHFFSKPSFASIPSNVLFHHLRV